MEYLSIIITVIAACCAITTCILGYLAFKQSRRLENENFLFRYKIEAYFSITEQLVDFIDLTLCAKTKLEGNRNGTLQTYTVDELLEDADKIDVTANKLINLALRYTVILPEQMINNLTTLQNHIMGDVRLSDDADRTEYFLKFTEEYDGLLLVADKLIEMMRDELHTDKLNISLSKRLH